MNVNLLQTEFKLYFRDVMAVVFTLLLSPLILVILGSVPAFREPDPTFGGLSVVGLYVPIMLAMAIAMVAINAMPVHLATYRERGILRRLATTPVQPRDLLTAIAAVHLTVLMAGAVMLIGLGWLAFGVDLPRNPIAYILAFVLSAVALFGFGLLLASLGSSKAAQGLGTAAFVPMMFFAGLYVPREFMPDALRTIGEFTPLGAGVQALQDSSAGHWPQPLHIAVLVAYTAVAWLAAARYFRWQ